MFRRSVPPAAKAPGKNEDYTIIALALARAYLEAVPVIIDVFNIRGLELLHEARVDGGDAPFLRTGPFRSVPARGNVCTLLFFLDFPTLQPGATSRVLTPGQHQRQLIAEDLQRRGIGEAADLLRRMAGGTPRDWRGSDLPADTLEAVLGAATQVIEAVGTSWAVERVLGYGERSIVRVVRHPDLGVGVLKTFRAGAAQVADHEADALQLLGAERLTPRLLLQGPGWLVMEYIDDHGTHIKRRIPGSESRQLTYEATLQALELLTTLRELQCFILDLGSHNLLSNATGDLFVVDLEFFGRYESGQMPPLIDDLTVVGNVPDRAPQSSIYFTTPREHRWWQSYDDSIFRPAITGLTRAEVASGQIPHRSTMAARQLLYWWLLLAVHLARHAVRTVNRVLPRHQ